MEDDDRHGRMQVGVNMEEVRDGHMEDDDIDMCGDSSESD
jgi:hypothetical protein